jgi:hypothetical protein
MLFYQRLIWVLSNQADGDRTMATKQSTDQVLWMADCYSLAKRFPNPHTWLALLEPTERVDAASINPFHYWLWMEIWKAAQLSEENSEATNIDPPPQDRSAAVATK